MINEIQHRLDKVKGTWTVDLMPDASDDGSTYPYVSVREGHGCDIEQIFSENEDEGHIDFIAHAPTDIKYLLGEVERLEKLAKWALSRACNKCTDMARPCKQCDINNETQALGDNHG